MVKIKNLTLFAFSLLAITTMKSMEKQENLPSLSFPKPHFQRSILSVPRYLYNVESNNHSQQECADFHSALSYINAINIPLDSTPKADPNLEEFLILHLFVQGHSEEIMKAFIPVAQASSLHRQLNIDAINDRIAEPTLTPLLEKEKIQKQLFIPEENTDLAMNDLPQEDLHTANSLLLSVLSKNIRNLGVSSDENSPQLCSYKVLTGKQTKFYKTARPEEVTPLLEKAFEKLASMLQEKIHPIICASYIHNQIVSIHGFNKGNGRIARLLLNFILMQHGYSPIKIFNTLEYRTALRKGDNAFALFIIKKLEEVKNVCHWCEQNTENEKNRCSRCKSAQYCSRKCQNEAWKNGHKTLCLG